VEHHPVHVSAIVADSRLGLRSSIVFHAEQRDLRKPAHNEAATKSIGKLAKLHLIDHATALAIAREEDVFIIGPAFKVPLIIDDISNLPS